MDKIDNLLERLRGEIPTVPDAESLTGSIMAALDGAERKDHVPIPLWIIVTRTVSTAAAAAAMLFWFIHVTEPKRTAVVQETPVLEITGSEPGLFTESTADEIIKRQLERSMRHQIKRTTKSLIELPYEKFDN